MKAWRLLTLALALSGTLRASPLEEDPIYLEGESALYAQKYARAREVAEQLLRANAKNYAAQLLLGKVYLYGEGSVPRAYYCFRRCQQEVETRAYGDPATTEGPWKTYAQVLLERAQAAQQLGKYQESCDLIDKHDLHFDPDSAPVKGFSLIKLGRVQEARELMLKCLDDPKFAAMRGHTLNNLGNLEFEADNLEKALEYFTTIAEEAQGQSDVDPVYWSNAGEAARDLCRHDLAEKNFLKATETFNPYTYSDPWGYLAETYASENRMPEALAAVKSMQAWRISGSAQVSQNKWSLCYFRSGLVLLQMGYDQEAVKIFRRLIHRPDRNSATSTDPDLVEARMIYVYAYALQFHGQRLREQLSYCSWRQWPGLMAQWLDCRRELHSQRQRVANLVCSHKGLTGFVLPYGPKALDFACLSPACWSVFGARPVMAAVEANLKSTRPEAEVRRPYLLAVLGEACAHNWQRDKARELLEEALAQLPAAEAKLRLRCQAVLAQVLAAQGKRAEAMQQLRQLMDSDPSQLRACELSLPLEIQVDGSAAAALARRWLYASPRCVREKGSFLLVLTSSGQQLEGRLVGPDGTQVGNYRGQPRGNPAEAARSLCEAFHVQAFAPIIDLSQADIRSIDGSTGVARPDLSKQLTE